MKVLARIRCALGAHEEELFRNRKDHRQLVWVCKRCGKVTRHMKLKHAEMKSFRGFQKLHG